MTEPPVTYRGYYRRWARAFKLDLLRLGKEQMIGAVLAILILAFQWWYRLIPQNHGWQAVKALGWPYLILILLLCLISALRAPVTLDRGRAEVATALAATIATLEHDKATLAKPKVSPQEERRRQSVSETITKLNAEGKKILRYINDRGSVDRISLEAHAKFNSRDVNWMMAACLTSGLLIIEFSNRIAVNPELKSAVDFVLDSEGL